MSSYKKNEWEKVVRDLDNLIKENDWSENFSQAIHDAKSANVPDLDRINSLEDYMNAINEFLFWKPTENERGDVVYNKICLFYWILNQKTLSSLQSETLPKAVGKPLTVLSAWMVEYAKALGTFYDTTESINKETIDTFYHSPPYHMEIYERPPNDWQTFNEFFARHVKPGERDPDHPQDNRYIVSAADSVFDGWWDVNSDSEVIFVKGIPWNISSLLEGSKFADAFRGGKFMHAFLNTTDYHRLQAPVGGKILEAKVISGAVYLEVVPTTDNTPQSLPVGGGPPPERRNKFAMRRRLEAGKTDANIIRREYQHIPLSRGDESMTPVKGVEAPDNPGYQFLQARGCIVIESDIGLVAVLPIGMAQVSSVGLSVTEGDTVNKGKEISYFQFGGSDIVLVFEPGSQVDLTAKKGVHYNTGKTIGTAKIPTRD